MSLLLEEIKTKSREGQMSTRALAKLTGYDELRYIDARDTELKSIKLVQDDVIRFRFNARNASTDTDIYQIIGINHWEHSVTSSKLVAYSGPTYVIHNHTSGCIKGVGIVTEKAKHDSCLDGNNNTNGPLSGTPTMS